MSAIFVILSLLMGFGLSCVFIGWTVQPPLTSVLSIGFIGVLFALIAIAASIKELGKR